MQAGIVASLDELVKEFVKASGEEKKAIVSKIEEEVGKLEGSSARSTQSLPILIRFFLHITSMNMNPGLSASESF